MTKRLSMLDYWRECWRLRILDGIDGVLCLPTDTLDRARRIRSALGQAMGKGAPSLERLGSHALMAPGWSLLVVTALWKLQ